MMDAIKNYPRKDGRGQDRYVKYPALRDGKWYAADVMQGGYMISIWAVGYGTMGECQKACDVENKFWGYTLESARLIVAWSMGFLGAGKK